MKKKITKKTPVRNTHDADQLWRFAWTYIRTVIDTVREPFLILDPDLRVLSANKTFFRFFHVTKKATEGTLVYDLGDGQWDIPSLRKLLEKILPKDTFFVDYEVDHEFPQIGRKILLLNARRIHSAEGTAKIILLAMEDITKRKELEEKLRDYTTKLTAAVSDRTKELELRVLQLEKSKKRE
jgi:PAS domain S-box-containing protein